MESKKGFTLVELLVVVLIIGILTAIAVPQYQLAVDKTHFANLQAQVKSIKASFDNYYLATGEYPNSFDKLDVSFPGYRKQSHADKEECYIFTDSYCCVGKPVKNNQEQNVICAMNDYSFAYAYYLNQYRCIAANENTRAKRLCRNVVINKSQSGNMNIMSPYGHQNNNGKKYSYHIMK